MGLLDEIRRELGEALEEARRAAEAEAGPPGPAPYPRPSVSQPAPERPKPAASDAGRAGSGSPAALRVGGKLQRERLERLPPPPVIKRAGKAQRPGQPASLAAFDLDLPETAPRGAPVTRRAPGFSPQDLVRALVLGRALDMPKGRRPGRFPRR